MTMENFEQPTTEEQAKNIELTREILHYFLITSRWEKFQAIIGLGTIGLLMVFSNPSLFEDYGAAVK